MHTHHLAGLLADEFETAPGEEGFYIPRWEAPEWLKTAVSNARGVALGFDAWTADRFHSILSTISDSGAETVADVDPLDFDDLVDDYTNDLTGWLHRSVHNVYFLSEAINEGVDGLDGFTLLREAQAQAIREVAGHVISLLRDFDEDEAQALADRRAGAEDEIDEWRGDVCMALRELGRDDLADEVGGWGNEDAAELQEDHGTAEAAAQHLHEASPPTE